MKIRTLLAGILTMVLIGLTIAGPAKAQIQPAQGFDATAMNSVLALYGLNHKEHVAAYLCTAFVVQKDATGYVLMSAGHCVDDLPAEITFAVAEKIRGPLTPVTPISARYSDTETNTEDYFRFHLITKKNYPVLELGSESSEHVGDNVIVPNFAQGLIKQLAYGMISSQITEGSAACPTCVNTFLIQGMLGPGASGAPVISANTHKVVGILVSSVEPIGFLVEPMSIVRHSLTQPDEYEQLHQIHPLDLSKFFNAPPKQ